MTEGLTPEPLSRGDFVQALERVVETLDRRAKREGFAAPLAFEQAVNQELRRDPTLIGLVDYTPGTQRFPDIVVAGRYGVEVKFKIGSAWREVANSVFEGSRDRTVEEIFIVFCKMGNGAGVRFRPYSDAIVHVRTSHMPRFAISMDGEEPSLFNSADERGLATTYENFRRLPDAEKMRLVKEYAKRKHPGKWLWWIDQDAEPVHALEPEIRIYTELPSDEKRKLRAEAIVLCPDVLAPGKGGQNQAKTEAYAKAAIYWLRAYGVFSGNNRDAFTADSVVAPCPDGNRMRCALRHIQRDILTAFENIDAAVIEEYWGLRVDPSRRREYWLKLADKYAAESWRPSDDLFQ